MDFYTISNGEDELFNPYGAKIVETGEWIAGMTSVEFLNAFFGQYATAQEMIDATTSEGLKLFFAWLKDQDLLP